VSPRIRVQLLGPGARRRSSATGTPPAAARRLSARPMVPHRPGSTPAPAPRRCPPAAAARSGCPVPSTRHSSAPRLGGGSDIKPESGADTGSRPRIRPRIGPRFRPRGPAQRSGPQCQWRAVRWSHAARIRHRTQCGALRGRQPLPASGDQPTAIDDLERRIRAGEQGVVLLGATGVPASPPPLPGRSNGSSGPPWSWRRTRRWPPQLATSSASAAEQRGRVTSCRTTTTTSPSVRPADDTYIEKDPRSTRRWSGCGIPPPAPC